MKGRWAEIAMQETGSIICQNIFESADVGEKVCKDGEKESDEPLSTDIQMRLGGLRLGNFGTTVRMCS